MYPPYPHYYHFLSLLLSLLHTLHSPLLFLQLLSALSGSLSIGYLVKKNELLISSTIIINVLYL